MNRDKILVIGSLNYDIFAKIDKMPQWGETLPAADAGIGSGGKAGNQAVQAAKLGKKVLFYAKVGTDPQGEYLIESLQRNGVNTDYIEKTEGMSGLSFANIYTDGSVFSTIVHGANYKITKEDIDKLDALFEEAEFVVLQLEIPVDVVEYIISKAKSFSCKIVLNAAPAENISEEALKDCYLLIFNEVEAGVYYKKLIETQEEAALAAETLARQYDAKVIITLGSKGSVLTEGAGTVVIPPEHVEHVADTTGAGDSYVGAVVAKLQDGQTLEEAAKFAAKCSAFTIQGMGVQDSMPYSKDI